MKTADLTQLLKLIYRRRPVSRTVLAQELDLSAGYISMVVQELIEKKILIQEGYADSQGGRRQAHLHPNPELAHLIGIDFGTANLRVVTTDFLGQALSFDKMLGATAKGKDYCLETACDLIKRRCARDSKIKAVGIAHSGVIDCKDGEVLFWPKVRGWEKVPLKKVIEQQTGLISVVEDSSRAMALAEWQFGQAKGSSEWVHVSLGMGIGSAIFTGGRLCYGQKGLAGELGHITINELGELCSCGNRGCLETLASGSAIIESIRNGLRRGATSSLAPFEDQLTIEVIADAAKAGDRLSNNVFFEAGSHLGTALADIVNLLNPEKIILGGSVARTAKELIMAPLMASLRQRAFHHSSSDLQVLFSELAEDAAAVGACLLAAEKMIEASLSSGVDRGRESRLVQSPLPPNQTDGFPSSDSLAGGSLAQNGELEHGQLHGRTTLAK